MIFRPLLCGNPEGYTERPGRFSLVSRVSRVSGGSCRTPFFLGGGFLCGFVLGESECSRAIFGLSSFGGGAGVL